MSAQLTVMLVAAEASGDVLGAGLARALKGRLGEAVRFVGVGGPEMAAEGVNSPFDIAEISIVGAGEAVRAYPRVRRRVRDTVAMAKRERPDVVVLIDSWGFTIRVARALRRAAPGAFLVKYVAPQVWASRPGRARVLARSVDLLLSIHGFEAAPFEAAGLRTVIVGNRAISWDSRAAADPARLRREIGAGEGDPILLVLLGSRRSEVERLAAPFGDAVQRLARTRPALRVVVPVAGTVAALVRERTASWRPRPILLEDGDKRDAYAAATAALVCSGTATTELALAETPMVVAYRVSLFTELVSKVMLRTRWITLINIAAGAEVAPELLQRDCTGLKLASAIANLLDDPERAARQTAAQTLALQRLGRAGPDPSERAAEAVLQLLGERGRLDL